MDGRILRLCGLTFVFWFLRKSTYISRISGIFVLLLFTLSITPKRFLHDALADHRDTEHSICGDVQEIFSAGFQCHADDLVVDAPFIPEATDASVAAPAFVRFDYSSPLYSHVSRRPVVSGVRGPPVMIAD